MAGRQMDRQAGRQTDRQKNKQITDTKKCIQEADGLAGRQVQKGT